MSNTSKYVKHQYYLITNDLAKLMSKVVPDFRKRRYPGTPTTTGLVFYVSVIFHRRSLYSFLYDWAMREYITYMEVSEIKLNWQTKHVCALRHCLKESELQNCCELRWNNNNNNNNNNNDTAITTTANNIMEQLKECWMQLNLPAWDIL